MATGHYISGIGHGALIAWALIGGLFSRTPEDPITVANVSIITSEEFDALSAPQPSPDVEENIPAPPQPEIEDTPPDAPVVEPPPEIEQPPVVETPPPADEAPEVPENTPPVVTDIEETPPEPPQPPAEENPVVMAPPAEIATPRPAPRVAPDPAAQPAPDIEIADETREDTAPDPEAQTESEPSPETAPVETTNRIVTEADEPPSSAPTASARPSARPKRPTPPVETADTTNDNTRDAIEDVLASVQDEGSSAPASSAPTGPPLSFGEKDALRVAVSNCWTVDVGGASARVTVVVAVSLDRKGEVIDGSLQLIGSDGGDDTAVGVAFRNARSAIIRCQKGGYKLPIEKYSHWRDIEMTFNPEKMRIK